MLGAEFATGSILRADVDGQILMRAYLSGTPECKFGLNDKLVLQKRYIPHGCPSQIGLLIAIEGAVSKQPNLTRRWSLTIVNSTNACDWASSIVIDQSALSLRTASLSSCGMYMRVNCCD